MNQEENIKNTNKAVFEYMKKVFPDIFNDFYYADNVIVYKGKSIMLDNFNLQEFLDYNSYIIRDLEPDVLFDAINVNAVTVNDVIPPTKASHETTMLEPIYVGGEYE